MSNPEDSNKGKEQKTNFPEKRQKSFEKLENEIITEKIEAFIIPQKNKIPLSELSDKSSSSNISTTNIYSENINIQNKTPKNEEEIINEYRLNLTKIRKIRTKLAYLTSILITLHVIILPFSNTKNLNKVMQNITDSLSMLVILSTSALFSTYGIEDGIRKQVYIK